MPFFQGGEEYLTFSGCLSNLGRGMDPGSGVFTAPLSGAYLFIIHVCSHDMKKALLTLRKNGTQVILEICNSDINVRFF